MTTHRHRIWIVTARVGAGHVQAAWALAETLDSRGLAGQTRVIDLMDRVPDWFRLLYTGGYAALVSRTPAIYEWLYDATDRSRSPRPTTGERWRAALEREILNDLRDELVAEPPDWIVSTHFLATESLRGWIAEAALPTRQAVVVTDFYPHRVWCGPGVDRYYVANDMTTCRLIERGIDPARIRETGIPIRTMHRQPIDPEAARQRFGWQPGRPVVLLIAGADFVSGPVAAAVRLILSTFPGVTLQVVSGRNGGLRRRLARDAARHRNLHVVGHTDLMPELLAAATVVATKTGGLMTSECLAHGAALLALFPVPGQEDRNAAYLVDRGAALVARRLDEVVPALRRLLDDEPMRTRQQAVARSLSRPGAADSIIDDLLNS